MQKYHNTIQESNGDIITTATVTVYLANTGTPATLYQDDEIATYNNPFTVADGNYGTDGSFFFKTINGIYDIKIVNGASTTWIYDETISNVSYGIDDNATSTQLTLTDTEATFGGDIFADNIIESYANIAALRAITVAPQITQAKIKGYATDGDGGGGDFYWDATSTETDDGGTIIKATAVTTGRWKRIYSGALNVKWFGAKGDSVTNDIAAFTAAITRAKLPANTGHSAIYIPGLDDRKYYRIDSEWRINTDSVTIFGDGIASIIVQHNAAGANAITLDSNANHCTIRDIAIMGVVGSGNGIEIKGTSHYGMYSDIFISHMDASGLKVTSGQSGVFKNVQVDQNSGYEPTTIVGATKGSVNRGIVVVYDASGNTNNQSFINCRLNGANGASVGDYALQVGDPGNPVGVTTFSWIGGVIQGTASNELVYIKCDEPFISSSHFESATTATEYIMTIDGSRNASIKSLFCLGDINISGTNRFLTLEDVSGVGGIDIASTTYNSSIKNIHYRNNVTGPTSGLINNSSSDTRFENVTSANGDHTAIPGGQLFNPVKYFGTDMETWVGGASPTKPCGFDIGGGGTVTRETTTIRTGTYSAKVVYTSANTQGLRLKIEPLNAIKNKKITIITWVYVSAGIARIRGVESGTTSYTEDSKTTSAWERMEVTLLPTSAATSFTLLFTAAGASATVYWDSINIYLEDYTHIKWKEDATASVNLSVDTLEAGYPVPLIFASGTTTVTALNAPHVGIPFTLYFDAAKTITNSAAIQLAGGVNFVSSADDTLTLVYCDDGVFREVSRSVN